MNTFRVIRHPLDRFAFTGSLGDLDYAGRAAADHLMTMISDMRFRKESLWGICARYFLLVDLSRFPQFCSSITPHSDNTGQMAIVRQRFILG